MHILYPGYESNPGFDPMMFFIHHISVIATSAPRPKCPHGLCCPHFPTPPTAHCESHTSRLSIPQTAPHLHEPKGKSVSTWRDVCFECVVKTAKFPEKNDLGVLSEYLACTTQLHVVRRWEAACYCVCAVARRDRKFENRGWK